MYETASKFQNTLYYSWDIVVIAILLITIIYIFGTMLISSGLPQYYVERYFLTLVSAIIGFELLFAIFFYSGVRETINLFTFPIINLSYIESGHFLAEIIAYSSSSTFILFFLLLVSIPLVTLYHSYFQKETELRQNGELVPTYERTLKIVLVLTLLIMYSQLGV
ncbi:hypothetical protein [Priestia aryabhattai]